MLTVREIKERTETFFKQKGVPNAKLDTDILIAHSLGFKRLDLYLDMDRPLTEAQLAELRPLVKRRANREPLQYVIGCTEFYGLNLRIDARALIPRHETEELVEIIAARLAPAPGQILDLGTGSGALALALATKYPDAQVTATDRSADALALAAENARALGLAERVQFHKGDWFEPLKAGLSYDLIVANPPYLTEAEMATTAPEVAAHEPLGALAAGHDGLDDLREILASAKNHLNPNGLLALETGIGQHTALHETAQLSSLTGESLDDLSGRPRFFFATRML
jgi:release factor glutamine methyltransferase